MLTLLFAAQAWLVFHGLETNLAFAGLAASTGMYPEVDLVLLEYPFAEHHGSTHGVFFLAASTLVVGAVVTGAYLAVRDGATPVGAGVRVRDGGAVRGHARAPRRRRADESGHPPPVEPPWPVVREPVVFDAAFVKSKMWNLGPLALGVVAQIGLGIRECLGR